MFSNGAQFPEGNPPAKKKNRVRDAAALAAGGGVLAAGLGIHKAAGKVGAAVEKTAADASATLGSVKAAAEQAGRFGSKVKRQLTTFPTFKKIVRKFLSAKVELASKPSVAQDRYKKQIYENESNRATSNYTKSALAGALVGAALKGRKGATVGAAAGLATQAAIRASTAHTKDNFGERSHVAKKIEKAPALVGTLVAAGLASKKLKGGARKLFRKSAKLRSVRRLDAAGEGLTVAQKVLQALKNRKTLRGGVALTGGLAVADAAGHVATKDANETTGNAVKKGLIGGGVTGAVLAGAEHGIDTSILKAAKKIRVRASRRMNGRLVELRASHHSDQEGRDEGGKFKDSIASYIEKKPNYAGDPVSIADTPVLRSAYRKAQVIGKHGSRAARLGKDAVGALRGERKTDERGRPQKREWEKSYFKHGVRNVAIAGATLGGAAYLKSHPETYNEIKAVKNGITGTKTTRVKNPVTGKTRNKAVAAPKTKVGKAIVGGAEKAKGVVKKAARHLFAARLRRRLVTLGYYDRNDWDLRDPRGKSARVFAPGSQQRVRRPKKWHEKVENQRKIGAAVATVGTVAGLLTGHAVGAKRAESKAAQVIAALKKRRRPAPNKGMKKVRTPDGDFYAKPGRGEAPPPAEA